MKDEINAMNKRSLLYPFSSGFGGAIGFYQGENLAYPLSFFTRNTDLSFISLPIWLFICKWGLVSYLIAVGAFGYKNFDLISDLRFLHRMTYWSIHDEIKTPGSVWSDLLWAYSLAALGILIPIATFLLVCISIPLSVTTDLVFRILLLFVSMYPAQWLSELVAEMIKELFNPKKLKHELEQSGLYMNIILAHREDILKMTREGKDPRTFVKKMKDEDEEY
jgi:hypothetical protein